MGHETPPLPRRSSENLAGDQDLAEQMSSASDVDKPSILVRHLTDATSGEPLDWVEEFTGRIEEFAFSVTQIRQAATDLAWMARVNGQRYLNDDDRALLLGVANTRNVRLALAYIHGQRLRFDYKFSQLHRCCVEWLAEFTDDALILALATFAAMGSRASNALNLFRRAVDAPDADDKSNHVCLTAIWFADHIPEQAEIMLRLSDEMMARGQEDPVVHWRRAAAYRKLRRFDEAIREIDKAIDELAIGDNLVHEQFAQERRAIILSRDLQKQIDESAEEVASRIAARVDERVQQASADMEERVNEASLRLAQRVDVAQEMVSSGLLKMVEILGLFVALAGFIAGSGTVVIKAQSFGQRAAAMGLVLVGSLTFFGMLRLVTTVRRRRPSDGE